jgi:hypothetical protein
MPPKTNTDDLDADKNLKRIDDLESFRKEFEGKAFDAKVLQSLKDSHPIRLELSSIVWDTIRGKVAVIFITLIGIIVTDLAIRAIPHILSAAFGN